MFNSFFAISVITSRTRVISSPIDILTCLGILLDISRTYIPLDCVNCIPKEEEGGGEERGGEEGGEGGRRRGGRRRGEERRKEERRRGTGRGRRIIDTFLLI
jgi:hypothetical protein